MSSWIFQGLTFVGMKVIVLVKDRKRITFDLQTKPKGSSISVLIAVRAKLLRHLPQQQDSGWRVRGSRRVREDFASRLGQVHLMVSRYLVW